MPSSQARRRPSLALLRRLAMPALAGALIAPLPAQAQDTLAETRLRKMEAEIRALQRTVFPGGDERFFEPEIRPAAPGGTTLTGQPSTSAVADILARLDAMESQIARLTGQIEQNGNRIATLEARAGIAAAPSAAGASAAATPAPRPASPPVSVSAPPPAPASPQANLNAMTGGASASASAAAPTPSAARLAQVSAIVKPQTDDAGDDEYSYGFRLWDAKFYPEAQQQLKLFLQNHPNHARASWGRNLLGRAYLDAGDPREAAKWFLQNYQADKRAARAADSLLYLGVAMKQVGDTKRACIALAEFSETYAAEAAGRLKGLYDETRRGLSCG